MRVDAEDGRIYLPKRFREKFGERFELIDRGDRLLLIPLMPIHSKRSARRFDRPRSPSLN